MTKRYLGRVKFAVHMLSPQSSVMYLGNGRETATFGNTIDITKFIADTPPALLAADQRALSLYSGFVHGNTLATVKQGEEAPKPLFNSTDGPIARDLRHIETASVSPTAIASLAKLESDKRAMLDHWINHSIRDQILPAPGAAVFRSISVDVSELYGLPAGTSYAGMSTELAQNAALRAMRLENVEWQKWVVNKVEWAQHTDSSNKIYSRGSIKFKKLLDDNEDVRYVDEHHVAVYVHVYAEDGNHIFSAEPLDESDSAWGKAVQAKEQYEENLRQRMIARGKGEWIPPVQADLSRPIATMSEDLRPSEREQFDDWWATMQRVNSELGKPPRVSSPEQQWSSYSAAGGPLSREDFNSAIAAAEVDKKGEGWFDRLTSALGVGFDKAADVALGLTDTGADVLKSWGPMGTAGVYSGVKVANAASDKGFPDWVLLGGGVLLIILLAK